jgi:hypothetical protein
LEDGIEGVQKLKPQMRIANEFIAMPDDHLHIAVECPMKGESQKLIANLRISYSTSRVLGIPCPSHHPSRSSLTRLGHGCSLRSRSGDVPTSPDKLSEEATIKRLEDGSFRYNTWPASRKTNSFQNTNYRFEWANLPYHLPQRPKCPISLTNRRNALF